MNRGDRWRRAGDRIVRRPRERELEPRRIRTHVRRRIPLRPTTTALLSLTGGFALLIATGTVALMLPVASVADGGAPFITAIFTATSAVCVTGLVVVESATYWTGFGQAAIAVLMFSGGLGVMTAGLLILAQVAGRITLNQRLIARETMGGWALGNVLSAGRYIFYFAVAAQLIGFVALFVYLWFRIPLGEAAWTAVFHAISAFNNAGFSILRDSDSLTAYQSDYAIVWVHGILIVLGGLSFPVVAELARNRRPRRWSLDTRLVVIGSILMWVMGGISMLVYEATNPATLGDMTIGDRLSNAVFQSITSRTAGFSTIDFSATRAGNDVLFLVLMFIGGASGSTAGGIKLNTFMVLVVAALASIRGRERAEYANRELAYGQVTRAIAVLLLSLLVVVVLIMALSITELDHLESGAFDFVDILFEAVSAFGTVGLSRGITAELTDAGKLVTTAAMYLGRLGPMTLALGLALRERRAVYRFAEERVRIG